MNRRVGARHQAICVSFDAPPFRWWLWWRRGRFGLPSQLHQTDPQRTPGPQGADKHQSREGDPKPRCVHVIDQCREGRKLFHIHSLIYPVADRGSDGLPALRVSHFWVILGKFFLVINPHRSRDWPACQLAISKLAPKQTLPGVSALAAAGTVDGASALYADTSTTFCALFKLNPAFQIVKLYSVSAARK